MANSSTERVQAASNGLDTDSAHEYIATTMAPVVENLLTGLNGKLTMRGPVRPIGGVGGSNNFGTGAWSFDDKLLLSFSSTFWVPPGPKSPGHGALAPNQAFMDLKTASLTTGLHVADRDVSQAFARLGDFVYGPALDNATIVSGVPLRNFMKWDGTAVTPIVVLGPRGAVDIAAFADRIFVLGGTSPAAPGAAPLSPNGLWYSIVGGPTGNVLADWQDPVSGLINKLVVESTDNSDVGVGLARVGKSLVIFKRRSIQVLNGGGSSNFSISTVTNDIGCVDRRSIIEAADGVYFASDHGMMFFDGSAVRSVTGTLASSLVAAIQQSIGEQSTGGYCWTARLPNSYVLIVLSDSTGAALFSGLLNTREQTWSTMSVAPAALNFTGMRAIGRTATVSWVYDGSVLANLNAVTAPELVATTLRGFDDLGEPSKGRIPSKFYSRLVRLSAPSSVSVLQRILVDHRFAYQGAVTAGLGWFVSVLDGQGNVLLSERQLPSQLDPALELYRLRTQLECRGAEAVDAQVRFSYKDDGSATTPAVAVAELYDTTIEFVVARDRPSV